MWPEDGVFAWKTGGNSTWIILDMGPVWTILDSSGLGSPARTPRFGRVLVCPGQRAVFCLERSNHKSFGHFTTEDVPVSVKFAEWEHVALPKPDEFSRGFTKESCRTRMLEGRSV